MSSDELKQRIILIIGAIPPGSVSTYGTIAKMAGIPTHARFVGSVLRNLPTGSRIPWHRVINGRGEISFPYGSEKWQTQKDILESEGVLLMGDKVRLKQYLWQP
jgi:methylated-DNA-protein-cysteine methyltransferase-like protein